MKYHYLANQQATDGDYGLYRVEHRPKRRRTGPALSPRDVRGVLRVVGNDQALRRHRLDRRTPNDFLYVPPGGIHGFRNEADEPTSILMLFAPGAPREHYFEGFAQLGDLTDEERREWFIANDNFFID